MIRISLRIMVTASLLISVVSCQQPPKVDLEVEKKKIQAQINLIDQAHFTKDAVQFFEPNLDTFYDVRNGGVAQVNKADRIPGVQNYLDDLEAFEMERSHEPIIEVSEDGSMASYIGAVVVKARLSGKPLFWVVSWQSVFKKIDDKWRIVSTANTEASEAGAAQMILQKAKEVIGSLPEHSSVYAMADCHGPIGDFKTLVLSNRDNGRMEQHNDRGRMVLKHGKEHSWTMDITNRSFRDSMSVRTLSFVKGHEFHWLSLRPEDRLRNPSFDGFEEFEQQTAFKVKFRDFQDKEVYFYYSFDDYTPLGFDYPSGEGEFVTTHFKDWKVVNDIRVFQRITIDEGDKKWHYNFTDVLIGGVANEDLENRQPMIE